MVQNRRACVAQAFLMRAWIAALLCVCPCCFLLKPLEPRTESISVQPDWRQFARDDGVRGVEDALVTYFHASDISFPEEATIQAETFSRNDIFASTHRVSLLKSTGLVDWQDEEGHQFRTDFVVSWTPLELTDVGRDPTWIRTDITLVQQERVILRSAISTTIARM